MTDPIIALLDGSTYARSVCDHALWAATKTGAGVELLHVLGRREAGERTDLSGAITLGARSALLEEMADLDARRARLSQQRGRAILEDAAEILREGGVTQVTTSLRNDDLVEAVAARGAGASMLMIGKRGEAADFAKGHLGSNLERVVRASHRPVFVASRAFKPVEKTLLAFDGSASATRALELAASSPLFDGLPIRVVTAGADRPEPRAALEGAAARLKKAGRAVETALVQTAPEEALAQMIEQEEFGLLLMGAYGHSRIRSLIIGSTTAEMLRSCKAPVVLAR